MNQTGCWTIGPCAANRHTVAGPADAFPPACDGCVREALEADAVRYRYLRTHLGLGFAVMTLADGFLAGSVNLDEAVDKARGSETVDEQ